MIDPERLTRRLVQLTRDLVLIESTEARPEERRRCFQLLINHLEEIPNLVITMFTNGDHDSLVALPAGIKRPDLLFCGHLDVVEHASPDSYRSEIKDSRIYGPGAGDMKGQLAILVELMKDLLTTHPGLAIGLAISSDEEIGGEAGFRFLVEDIGLDCDAVILPDGGSLTDITVEEKGILHVRLGATGHAAHAARPWLGDNALQQINSALRQIEEHFALWWPRHVDPHDPATHWFPTATPTMIRVPNDSPNRIPEEAEAVIDIRFPPGWTDPHSEEEAPPHSGDLGRMLDLIHTLVGPHITVSPIVGTAPTRLSPDPLFIAITEEVMGSPANLVRACGGSDARFFNEKGIPVMLSRPKVGNLHGPDEWIDIRSMVDYFRICHRYTIGRCAAAQPAQPPTDP
jgi:succinyl-diaminopimelate desuccinylase